LRRGTCSEHSAGWDIGSLVESGDLAYTVGLERGEVSVYANPPTSMTIRVTHIYRRIDQDGVSSIVAPISHPPTSAPEIRVPPALGAFDVGCVAHSGTNADVVEGPTRAKRSLWSVSGIGVAQLLPA
jgi:hypothetical protein